MKKKELEILLEKVPLHPNPKHWLEQYRTPPEIAADILYMAYQYGDIENKTILDFGCGTGMFAIGASIFGAEVTGIEIDDDSLNIAKQISESMGMKVNWLHDDIGNIDMSADTLFQNPPFGAQKKHADMPFLIKAMQCAKVVYTIHNGTTEDYINKKVLEYGGHISLKKTSTRSSP
jgi:putative methylase